MGLLRRQLEQGGDRCPGTGGGSRLDQIGDDHEERDDAGFLIASQGDAGHDRQGDQFVHVHLAGGQVSKGLDDQRDSQGHGAEKCQHLGLRNPQGTGRVPNSRILEQVLSQKGAGDQCAAHEGKDEQARRSCGLPRGG